MPRTLHDSFGLTGTTLEGQYRVEAIVGEGGFGVVYRGRHISLDQPVAIKALKGLDAADPRINEVVLGKFREEARLLYTLSQSSLHIVRSMDFGAVTTPTGVWAPFMVLEWLEGQSLQEELMERRQRRMPPHSLEETLAILGPVAEGLGIAHQHQVAHRDVKPANIFLVRDGANQRVKVLDFGIAKIMKEGEQAGTRGTFASFTWLYAAPEQLDPRVGQTGLATDVYGFALVFTELLTGKPPVDERDVVSILKASTDPTRRPTPRTRGANIPDDVEVILRRALAVDPKSRYSNITELWTAIASARGSRPSVTSLQAAQPAPPSVVISSGANAMHATATSMGAATNLAPTYQQRPSTGVPVSPQPVSPPLMTPPPMTSPPIGTRPPGMMMGPPMAAPIAPYAASPPMGTAPPGQVGDQQVMHQRRMMAMQQQQGGSNTLVIVTVIIFVLLLLFTGMCAAVGSACSS